MCFVDNVSSTSVCNTVSAANMKIYIYIYYKQYLPLITSLQISHYYTNILRGKFYFYLYRFLPQDPFAHKTHTKQYNTLNISLLTKKGNVKFKKRKKCKYTLSAFALRPYQCIQSQKNE